MATGRHAPVTACLRRRQYRRGQLLGITLALALSGGVLPAASAGASPCSRACTRAKQPCLREAATARRSCTGSKAECQAEYKAAKTRCLSDFRAHRRACAGDPSSTEICRATSPEVFVGTIAGSDALIGMVVQDGKLVAYSCGRARTWGSHTGWFYASVEGGQIPSTTSAKGHRLEGRLDGNTASGSFTLPDGQTLRWRARRARPDSGAGLYSHDQDGQLTGLIVTNTGKMAGASRLATGNAVGLYAPVQVTTPPSRTNPTPGVSVTFPDLPTRNLTLTPVNPLRHMVLPPSPTIVVLLHGATARTPIDDIRADGLPGTRKHARHYWTYPFVAALLGADPGLRARPRSLVTLEGTDITGNLFLTEGLTLPGQGTDQIPASRDCTFGDMMTAENYTPGQATPPQLTLLLGHRDAKESLVEQAMYAVDQVHACVSLFEQTFRRKPKLVFVAHSWGGLITRFILSSPTRNSLAAIGRPLTLRFPVANDRYDVGDLSTRVQMDYLRDLTYYAVSLATPHEGVRFADRVDETLRAVGVLRGSVAAADEAQERLLNDWRNLVSLVINLPYRDAVRAEPVVAALAWFEQFAQGFLATNRVLAESHTGLWQALNTGPLHPRQAVRTDQSPIVGAKNRLIPLYVLGARNPGSTVADTLDLARIPGDFMQLAQLQKGPRTQVWNVLTILGDSVYRILDLPTAGRPPVAGFASRLDRTERVDAVALLRTAFQSVAPNLDPFFRAQFGSDSAGLLRFMLARLRVESLTVVPIFLNQGFAVDLNGSVELPVPRWSCGGWQFSMNYAPLVSALADTFGSLQDAAIALNGLDYLAFLAVLEGRAEDLASYVAGFVQFMADTIAALANSQGFPSTCVDPSRWTLSWPLTTSKRREPFPPARR